MADYETLPDGLLVRRCTHGTVIVNDTAAPITDAHYGPVPAQSGAIDVRGSGA